MACMTRLKTLSNARYSVADLIAKALSNTPTAHNKGIVCGDNVDSVNTLCLELIIGLGDGRKVVHMARRLSHAAGSQVRTS